MVSVILSDQRMDQPHHLKTLKMLVVSKMISLDTTRLQVMVAAEQVTMDWMWYNRKLDTASDLINLDYHHHPRKSEGWLTHSCTQIHMVAHFIGHTIDHLDLASWTTIIRNILVHGRDRICMLDGSVRTNWYQWRM